MKIYSAKWIVPMDAPAFEDGEVVVEDGRIEAVRPLQTPANERRDLGNAILLPGLINAHTHLEYTALRGFIEDVPFFPWVRTLNASKSQLDSSDWIVSAKLGALECLSSGTTTICDNTDSGASLDAANWSGLRGRIYQEFFCIDHRTSASAVADELADKMNLLSARAGDLLEIGISPHATYTINQEMFKLLSSDSRFANQYSSIHIAESAAESDLIERGKGPFAEMFDRRGIVWNSPHVSPTKYAADEGALTPSALLIHCVHQSSEDIKLVADAGASIIHCPKSNAKLGAGIAPLNKWLRTNGLRIGIGTDGAVSNNALDLFEEMRFALLIQRGAGQLVEDVTATDVLQLATIRGAAAIGMTDKIGSLTPGKQADMVAVRVDQPHSIPCRNPIQTIVYSSKSSDVILTMIDGRICYDEGRFADVDSEQTIAESAEIIKKLSAVNI